MKTRDSIAAALGNAPEAFWWVRAVDCLGRETMDTVGPRLREHWGRGAQPARMLATPHDFNGGAVTHPADA